MPTPASGDEMQNIFSLQRRRLMSLTPSVARELSGNLAAEKRSLEDFTAAMEREFLQLGGMLRRISLLARDVRDRSGAIMDVAAGRTDGAAIQFAFQLLKKAEDLVEASREQYRSVALVFEKMHLDLSRVARERSALMWTLSPLEMTNIQFRIQSCAFDENTRGQFFVLADTVAGIVHDVQSAVAQRFEQLDHTGNAAGELVHKLTALACEQRRETERMLAETRDQLSTLDQALAGSRQIAQSAAELGTSIAGGVGKAIVALQCQDMARQKFQHIVAAIEEMLNHLSSGAANGFSRHEERDCRQFLADASLVELGQLRAVFDQLQEAAGQVGAGLEQVESEAKSFAGHALRSGEAALDGEIIGRAVDSIHAVLRVIQSSVESIRNVVDLVTRLKSTFSDCTSQVLGLALRLRMVALNAQIFAAQVKAGAALEVVASNTRKIADEAMQQLGQITSRVTELVDAVVDLEQRLADYSELAAIEQKLLADEANEAEKKLHALDNELRTAIAAIGPVERELGGCIQRAIGSIRFPAAVAQRRAQSIAFFEQIAGSYAESRPTAHRKVQELKRHYTMVHERMVHESSVLGPEQSDGARTSEAFGYEMQTDPVPVANDRDSAEEPVRGPRIESEGEELAANVELF